MCLPDPKAILGKTRFNFTSHQEIWIYALGLWANTTLGLLAWWFVGTRQQPGLASITISRLPDLPVLDIRALTDYPAGPQAKALYDRFARQALPLPTRHTGIRCARIWMRQSVANCWAGSGPFWSRWLPWAGSGVRSRLYMAAKTRGQMVRQPGGRGSNPCWHPTLHNNLRKEGRYTVHEGRAMAAKRAQSPLAVVLALGRVACPLVSLRVRAGLFFATS